MASGTPVLYPRVLPVGDSALLIEFGSEIDPVINDSVHLLARQISGVDTPGILEVVPTYRSLLVQYDPLRLDYDQASKFVESQMADFSENGDGSAKSEIIEIPVVYGDEDGPDLETVAAHAGLSAQEVIDIHTGVGYRVYMLGFAPGFPYLGGLDERIACPRLKTPRLKVAAGSVGIAESQTGVYPNESPGGWQIIGRTSLNLFDPAATEASPALITPGSEVRFVPVKSHA